MATTNGSTNSSSAATPSAVPGSESQGSHADRAHQLNRLESLIGNVLTSRAELFRQLLDPRRNIDDECGYPSGSVQPAIYQELYDREAIAARVVEVLPRESWQVQPLVYEDDSSDNTTPFEEAWDDLGTQLRGESSMYKDEEGSPVWEYLRRADELSGIGQFGIILLGIDDGKDLREPVEGVDTTAAPGLEFPGSYAGTAAQSGPNQPSQPFAPYGAPQGSDAQYFSSSILTPGGNLPTSSSEVSDGLSDSGPSDGQGFAEEGQSSTDATDTSSTKGRRKLLFLRVFPESLVQITQYESRPTSPRFGQPVMYFVTLNDPKDQHSGIGLPIASLNVHWTRVIHIADLSHQASSSEVFAIPRMRPVLNRLLDLRKLYSGSAEMYWKGAFPGMSLETNPQLGGDVDINKDELRDMWEQYQNGLQRALFLMGMTAKTLSPTVVDPSQQIDVQITAICVKTGCPKRVFMGSERGELASSQDDQAWNDRLRERQRTYVTPRIIVPFIDRLIAIGILPKPNVRKPPPQSDKPFALKAAAPPAGPTHAIGPDGTPMPLVSHPGGPGAGGKPGSPIPAKGQPPAALGTFPPKAGLGKPPKAFPTPSANALPPRFGKGRPQADPTDEGIVPRSESPADGIDVETDPSDPYGTKVGASDPSDPSGDISTIPQESLQGDGNRDASGNPIAGPKTKPSKPGYRIEWPDLTSQSDSEKATVANTRTTALAAYIAGGVDALVPPMEFLTKIMGIDDDEAQSIIDAAARAQQDEKLEQAAQGGGIDPATGEPIPPALGPDGQPIPPDHNDPPGLSPDLPPGPDEATPDASTPDHTLPDFMQE